MTMPASGDWTYTNAPGSVVRDQVRFYYQDTDPAMRLLSDAEVDFCISEWIGQAVGGVWDGPYSHPLMAAHACALRVSAKFAGVSTVDADGVDVDLSSLQAKYKALASSLKAEHDLLSDPDAVVDYENLLSGSSIDPSIAPLDFAIGMHDNAEAGQQNYGGQYGAENFIDFSAEQFEHL